MAPHLGEAIEAPESLSGLLSEAYELNQDTRSLLGRWVEDEIDSAEVLTELSPLIAAIEANLASVEDVLANEYQIDRDVVQISILF